MDRIHLRCSRSLSASRCCHFHCGGRRQALASPSCLFSFQDVNWRKVTVRAAHPTEFIFSRFIKMLPSSFTWIFTFQNAFCGAASFYFMLSWQPNISTSISWEYSSALTVLCHLAKFCLCYSACIQKGIHLNHTTLWLSPYRKPDSCTPWKSIYLWMVPFLFCLLSLSHVIMGSSHVRIKSSSFASPYSTGFYPRGPWLLSLFLLTWEKLIVLSLHIRLLM